MYTSTYIPQPAQKTTWTISEPVLNPLLQVLPADGHVSPDIRGWRAP